MDKHYQAPWFRKLLRGKILKLKNFYPFIYFSFWHLKKERWHLILNMKSFSPFYEAQLFVDHSSRATVFREVKTPPQGNGIRCKMELRCRNRWLGKNLAGVEVPPWKQSEYCLGQRWAGEGSSPAHPHAIPQSTQRTFGFYMRSVGKLEKDQKCTSGSVAVFPESSNCQLKNCLCPSPSGETQTQLAFDGAQTT